MKVQFTGSVCEATAGLKQRAPLGNLFVSMLQGMGMENDRFGTSTGTVTGLDLA
ncbi:MAG: hypothetical protein ACI9TH_000551 [Kiritimatiellia bacterium]